MKIVGMAQIYNERKLGHLERALKHYSRLCDDMVVLDDASTDGSVDLARQYTNNVIVNSENNWDKNAETTNKALLLAKVLTLDPDWIVSFDADELFEKKVLRNNFFRNMLKWAETSGVHSLCFDWLQLWLEDNWYRIDNVLGKVSPPRVWRNIGNLKIDTVPGLHKRLWPVQMDNPTKINVRLLHYSSSSEDKLYGKISNYLRLHPQGNYLAPLDGTVLEEVDYAWFEDDNVLERKPQPDLRAVKDRIMQRLHEEFSFDGGRPQLKAMALGQ